MHPAARSLCDSWASCKWIAISRQTNHWLCQCVACTGRNESLAAVSPVQCSTAVRHSTIISVTETWLQATRLARGLYADRQDRHRGHCSSHLVAARSTFILACRYYSSSSSSSSSNEAVCLYKSPCTALPTANSERHKNATRVRLPFSKTLFCPPPLVNF